MSLHTDLLKQAHHLAIKEPRRPAQASLRRSISAAYYALFHRLVDDATCTLISRSNRDLLRQSISRAFHHSDMRSLSESLARGNPPRKLLDAFSPLPIHPTLQSIAQAFWDLQEARHQADYNTYRSFSRGEALYHYRLAKHAIDDWAQVRKSHQADAYLAGLLIIRRIQGH